MSNMEIVGLGFYFEDLPLGRTFQPICRTITEADIVNFINTTGMTEVLFMNMEFLAEECCGKCVPGREGTEVMVEILERLSGGEGLEGDIRALEELSSTMMLASLCGLGQAAPNPVMDSLQYFRDAYESRIRKNKVVQ